MKKAAAGVAIFLRCATSTARAVDVDEQSRRCDIEKNALRNSSHREGPECLKLRAMLRMPEPPQINNYYGDGNRSGGAGAQRVLDAQRKRWCWIYHGGSLRGAIGRASRRARACQKE